MSVTLTNSGDRAGEEVVQLYLRDVVASYIRPVKELKDFKKIYLKPGESKEIIFTITAEKLQFYTPNKKWEVEPGQFDVWVGGSSDAELKVRFSVVE